jgi:hypothetical protein
LVHAATVRGCGGTAHTRAEGVQRRATRSLSPHDQQQAPHCSNGHLADRALALNLWGDEDQDEVQFFHIRHMDKDVVVTSHDMHLPDPPFVPSMDSSCEDWWFVCHCGELVAAPGGCVAIID